MVVQSAGLKVKTFASARELLDQGAPPGPGCIVLDVCLPGLSGLDLQTELTSRNIQTPIIFITGHGDIPMSVKAMKGGAVDFLTKPFVDQDLLEVIQEALQKDERLKAAQTERAEIQHRLQTLTPREGEVLRLVVKGRMNKEIAAELSLSEKPSKSIAAGSCKKCRCNRSPSWSALSNEPRRRASSPATRQFRDAFGREQD